MGPRSRIASGRCSELEADLAKKTPARVDVVLGLDAPAASAALASASMLVAALMGHLAGWILEYGHTPGYIDRYARFIGTDRAGWTDDLTGAHSHQMVVALIAFVIALTAQQFRYRDLHGAPRALARLGLGLVAAGTVAMSGVYIANGAANWQPPAWFTSHQG